MGIRDNRRRKKESRVKGREIDATWRAIGENHGEIHEHVVDRLDPGEDHNFYWEYTYGTTGSFNSFAKVDYTNNVDESDEDNNTETYRITVDE